MTRATLLVILLYMFTEDFSEDIRFCETQHEIYFLGVMYDLEAESQKGALRYQLRQVTTVVIALVVLNN